MLVGVNVDQVISVTFIIGSSLAAVGGVLIGAHVGQINFAIGFLAGIKAFTAAVLGGIGSIPGAVLGGLVLGWAESFVEELAHGVEIDEGDLLFGGGLADGFGVIAEGVGDVAFGIEIIAVHGRDEDGGDAFGTGIGDEAFE